MGGGVVDSGAPAGNQETIATLAYGGSTTEASLPDQLLPVEPLPAPETVRQFTLNHGPGMVFLINGKAFDHNRIDTQVSLNSVEDWEVINTGTMTHPFHVHTNKFQVVSLNGQAPPYPAWKDVVSVSPGERLRIRIPFRDYPGKTVYHCHILDHEDRGMMGTLEMRPS
jgi:FtsP/CotA-like multicopper oxidase with cupredoxin domain